MTPHATSTTTTHGTPLALTFGLITIPIRIHKITDGARTTPTRSMFTPNGNPIGQVLVDKTLLTEGKVVPVDRAAVVKRTLVGDKWVELTDDEIAAQSTMTKGFAQIVSFVPLADAAENYRVEEEVEWRPDKVKIGKAKVFDPNAAKACALLSAAMNDRGLAALVLVPTTTGARYAMLSADGRGGWVSFAAGVRQVEEAPAVLVSEEELTLAGLLIDQIGVGCPVLVDETGERLREFLVSKAAGTAEAVVSQPVAASAPVVDLMAQLAASVAAAQAPKKAAKAARKVA